MQENTCCFTGHRDIKLAKKEILKRLRPIVSEAVKNGVTHFICGGALGFDTLAAEFILKLKKHFFRQQAITLEIAIPCPEQNTLWTAAQKQRYLNILKKSDKQTLICQTYTQSCYRERNRYMVDSSTLVIAFFDGSVGGTMQTINYARAMGKKVVVITPL